MAYIYLPREATGNLTISYNDHVFDVKYSKGYATHMIYSWNVQFLGETLFNVTYVGDDFGTLRTNGSIIVTPRVKGPAYVSQGEEFEFSMRTHQWVMNGKFDVYDYNNDVKGDLITSGIINGGVSSVSLSSNTLGLNKFYLEYDTWGSGKYYSIQELQVVKNSENIKVDIPSSVEEGNDVNVTITAPAVPYTFALISIDGNGPDWYSMENGYVTKTFSNLDKGTHKISFQYNNGYYQDGNLVGDVYSNTFSINVLSNAIIDAPNITTYYKGTEKFVVYLHDKENNPISKAKVKITLNDQTYTRTTDDEGKAYISTESLVPGNYVATVKYAGDDTYSSASTTANVDVKKMNTILTAEDVTVIYQDTSDRLIAQLKDTNGNPISGAKVTLTIGNLTKTMKTYSSGKAVISTKTLELGNYITTITFNGDKNYAPTSTTANVSVKKTGTVLTAKDVVATQGDSSRLIAELKDNEGNSLTGVKVKLTIGNLTKTMNTLSNGKAFLSTKSLAPGNYTAVISCLGNEDYAPSSITANVLIKKA